MSHSHIVVQHLLKQLESWRPGQKKRDVRPEWLTALIEELAEFFEPLTDVARVGFDCRMEDGKWAVRMYLGRTEIVGGSQDGHAKPISFELNLQEVVNRFERIDEFTWSVFPEDSEHAEEPRAYATIGGIAKGNPVRFYFFSVAPHEAGPGMRVYQDGRFEPV